MRRASLPGLFLASAVALTACSDAPRLDPLAPETSAAASLVQGSDLDTYLVRFRGNGIPRDFADRVASLGGEVVFAHARAGIASVAGLTPEGAEALGGVNGVAAVDADVIMVLDDELSEAMSFAGVQSPSNPAAAAFFGRQWNMDVIGAPAAWADGKLGAARVKVGILDTGIDYLHPDLYGRVDLALSRSFLSTAENERVPQGAHLVADLHYHGTHVAATVVSNGLAAAGVTSGPTLVGLKVCAPGNANNNFRTSCPFSAIFAAMLYSADMGLEVINVSLGSAFQRPAASARGGFGPSTIASINQVMNYTRSRGTLIVVAAGNSAFDLGRNQIPIEDEDGEVRMVTIPALYAAFCDSPAALCVSATGPTFAQLVATPAHPVLGQYINIQNPDTLAAYSNYGRGAIDVAAPGGNAVPIWAACSGFTLHPALAGCRGRFFNEATGAWGASVVGLAGTSMAAPHVAGLAALLASEDRGGPAQIAARIRQSADDLGDPGTDPHYGHGRINVARALMR